MTFDWYPEERQHKRVTLCNVTENESNIKDYHVARALMGMGLCEWEYYMGDLLVKAISNAREKNESTADITVMFSCDLYGVDGRGTYMTHQAKVVEHLMDKLFDTVSETEDELIVVIKQGLFA